MSKSERLKSLEAGIRRVLLPALEKQGFAYSQKTRSFKRASGECTEIIEVQAGQRSLEGRFTINLGVFHPQYCATHWEEVSVQEAREYDCLFDFRERLGVLQDTLTTRFFKRLISDRGHWFTWWLTTPPDKWWTFSSDQTEVTRSLESVATLLNEKGLAWLKENSNVELLRRAHEEQMRNIGKQG